MTMNIAKRENVMFVFGLGLESEEDEKHKVRWLGRRQRGGGSRELSYKLFKTPSTTSYNSNKFYKMKMISWHHLEKYNFTTQYTNILIIFLLYFNTNY